MRLLACCILIASFIAGCSCDRSQGEKKIIAQVNDYKMTVEDLKYELKSIPYDDKALLKSESGRKKYLDRLLEKEALLQEAQRQGIDREKDFMKSIENYWEQALLKILLERKSKEVSSIVHVYDTEIEEYYKNSGEGLPISKVRSEIREIIKQKKEAEAIDAWINELKERSYIKINEDVLKDAFLNNQ